MSLTYGRMTEDMSVRIRIISLCSSASSSRTLLFASTTSAGSTKTVFPVADSSWTIPLMRFFKAGAMGMTSLPSRMVGATSFSTSPSLCAERRILFNVRDMLPSVRDNSWRILNKRSDALSFIFPNLSRIRSIWRSISGKVLTSSVMRAREG